MYYPVPGQTHLSVLVPGQSQPRPQPRPVPRGTRPRGTEPRGASLVKVALDAAFGIRELRALQQARFDHSVRMHVAAKRRSEAAGPVRILSFHTRANGEVFGTAATKERKYGFAARIESGRLTSFKVL
ncbi:hypothetical protein [Corynebacterium lubricantis]|uniref:hypothetical protein n=1 Tax=Corynebacterium lubricantis TaxID=541095 RepID=UPI000475408B|nr:hypothetical protein [Corynebacterium lubricantis]